MCNRPFPSPLQILRSSRSERANHLGSLPPSDARRGAVAAAAATPTASQGHAGGGGAMRSHRRSHVTVARQYSTRLKGKD